jgi:hypothetical protein
VHLVDLHGFVCPNGKYAAKIGGVKMRSDGQHFTPDGGGVVWRWLAPLLHQIAAAK